MPTTPKIIIDNLSGFCFGVTTAIEKAEAQLQGNNTLFCLGDIVHNDAEVERLAAMGLVTISPKEFSGLSNVTVMLRAHGEPPETYAQAKRRNITLLDATCPVVLKLQKRIKDAYINHCVEGDNDTQILIYGRTGHAEVNGLVGQTQGHAIVIENIAQLNRVDFSRPVMLYSQTTKSIEGFEEIVAEIKKRLRPGVRFEYYDTICRQVSNRVQHLQQFASSCQVVLFVAGEQSSNGRVLYNHCKAVNPLTHLVAQTDDVDAQWLRNARSIGICGATSTPRWLMENVALRAAKIIEGF